MPNISCILAYVAREIFFSHDLQKHNGLTFTLKLMAKFVTNCAPIEHAICDVGEIISSTKTDRKVNPIC